MTTTHSDYDAVPDELRDRPQWVVWKLEPRDGKLTKVPYRVDGRTKAKPNAPRTWGTFEQAIAVNAPDVQGIGYVFSADDPYTGVDLDKCIDPETGELHPVADEILTGLGGYQERSPSRLGWHAIVEGTLTGDRHKTKKTPWGGEFEIYDRLRFFTITGNGDGDLCPAKVNELAERMFGKASTNGVAPAAASAPAPVSHGNADAETILDRHEDLAKIAARKGSKPKDDSESGWDHMLLCRAAEHTYGDAVLAALLRHVRRKRGEGKGERDDYVELTIAKVRQEVPLPPDSRDGILAQLTTKLCADQEGLTVVDMRVSGYGDAARVVFVFSDESELDFARAEHIANATKLNATLATTLGITTGLSALQARGVAALVRKYVGRSNEGRDRDQAVTWGGDFLRLAGARVFDKVGPGSQGSKFRTWDELDSHDPDDEGVGGHSAEAYARRCVVPVDRTTGTRYVRAGWFQEYVHRTGAPEKRDEVMTLMLDVGWQRPGYKGRIKATDPDGVRDPITTAFYVVPAGWEDGQEAEE